MMAAAGHANELRVHLKGALKNGCRVEEIQEVLLLLTIYCGIPAANEAHRVAAEVSARGEADMNHVRVRATTARLSEPHSGPTMRRKWRLPCHTHSIVAA